LSLYAVETTALIVLFGIYKTSGLDWPHLSLKYWAALTVGGIGLTASVGFLVRELVASGSSRRRALVLGVATNLSTAFLALLLLEATVRIASTTTSTGIRVGSVVLRPSWSELTARTQEILSKVAPWGSWDASYFVYDSELGWTVGANRQSPDEFYFSSVEGIRSGGPNIRMADQTYRYRIALIGDSYAFSFEVPFDQSWGYHLQRVLGEDVQVLNFGVDGYGIDQTYLRYQRDVLPWKPRVVLIGFSGHDLWRTMAVYPFVSFGWPGYVVKPRFIDETGELKLVNAPLPSPSEILSADRIEDLPLIEYDLGYGTTDWEWRFDHGPVILRFLSSMFPPWPVVDSRVSKEAATVLNARLLIQLAESIERSGAVPLFVLMGEAKPELVQATLSSARIFPLEASECLADVPVDRKKVPSGIHYSGLANKAIAKCTALAVERLLGTDGDPQYDSE